MENKLQLYIQDVGDTIHDIIAERFDSEYESVKTCEEYEAFGDGFCCSGQFIDEDDDVRIREQFENELTFDVVLSLLKKDDAFKTTVMDLVSEIAWNREVL
jgi:hypothetical protein